MGLGEQLYDVGCDDTRECRDGVCDLAGGPCARDALSVACERDLAEVFLRLATVGMYAQRCESRLVILERSEGWPWLSGVMAPHGRAKAKNL